MPLYSKTISLDDNIHDEKKNIQVNQSTDVILYRKDFEIKISRSEDSLTIGYSEDGYKKNYTLYALEKNDIDEIFKFLCIRNTKTSRSEDFSSLNIYVYNTNMTNEALEILLSKATQLEMVPCLFFRNCNLDDNKAKLISESLKKFKDRRFGCTVNLSDNPKMTEAGEKLIQTNLPQNNPHSPSDNEHEVKKGGNSAAADGNNNLIPHEMKKNSRPLLANAAIALTIVGVAGLIAGIIKTKFFHSPLNKFNLSNIMFGSTIAGAIIGIFSYTGIKKFQENKLFSENKAKESNQSPNL